MVEMKKLKDFLDEAVKDSPVKSLQLAQKLIELQGIEHYINLLYGVDLEIYVKPVEKREGRWLGRGIIDNLF